MFILIYVHFMISDIKTFFYSVCIKGQLSFCFTFPDLLISPSLKVDFLMEKRLWGTKQISNIPLKIWYIIFLICYQKIIKNENYKRSANSFHIHYVNCLCKFFYNNISSYIYDQIYT